MCRQNARRGEPHKIVSLKLYTPEGRLVAVVWGHSMGVLQELRAKNHVGPQNFSGKANLLRAIV